MQNHMVIKRVCLRKFSSKLLEDTYFKTIIPLVTFSISVWGRFSPATFVEIKGLHLKAAKIIEWLPKNIMDCDILQRVHRQNLGWFYKRRLAIEMSKEAKHMLNRLSQYVYKCGLIRRGKGLSKLIEVSREKRQSLGGVLLTVTVYCLEKTARKYENIDTFKRVLKTFTNKEEPQQVSFIKVACMNYNKDLANFV